MPQGIHEEEVAFYSKDAKLAGRLWIPAAASAEARHGAWIFFPGFTCTFRYQRDFIVDECLRVSRAGYVTMAFDYRGFGGSGGNAARLVDPLDQAEDVRSAITFLTARPEVDERRIGLVGLSLGGGIAPYVAATDERVAAVVSMFGVSNGHRWLRSLRSAAQWKEFLADLETNRKERTVEGAGRRCHALDILYVGTGTSSWSAWFRSAEERGEFGGEIPLESAERIIAFNAEEVVHRIAPRPALYVGSNLAPGVDSIEAISMFRASGEPRTLWLLSRRFLPAGKDHLDMLCRNDSISIERFETLVGKLIQWMKANLPNAPERLGQPDFDGADQFGLREREGKAWLRG